MGDIQSPTDISSSLAEFVRRERVLKELYQDRDERLKSSETRNLQYNDEELDNILQQMGRILSPVGQESDDRIYKRVMVESEKKSIEQILNEAKELVSKDNPIVDSASIGFSTDNLSSVGSENDVTFINIEDSSESLDSGKYRMNKSKSKVFTIVKDKNPVNLNDSKCEVTSNNFPREFKNGFSNEQNEKLLEELLVLREEVQRVNQLCESHQTESLNLRSEIHRLEQKWLKREKQLQDENHSLKQNIGSSITRKSLESLQIKLNNANDTIAHLKSNLKQMNEDWRKKEIRLNHECDQLRHQLKSAPKFAQPDFEKLQEQLKDTQEMNVKLKLDFDSFKDKCSALENLCTDLKKVIMDEQLAEKVYANDNIPVSVKQYLSSSSSSVMNTLSNMFACLSRSNTRNRNQYGGQKEKNELFTTNESLLINDLSKSHDHGDLVRELFREKEHIRKENLDLTRQVKELENIVRRRAHSNFSHVSEIIKNDQPSMYDKESEVIKNLKKELLEKQHDIIELKNRMVESKAIYDQNLLSLQSKIVNIQEDSIKMKEELEKKKATPISHVTKCRHQGRSCDPPQSNARSVRIELSAKEREVQLLNKQLDELKKTNRRLLRDKENFYLSSKEQSAEEIQLNKVLSSPRRINEKTNQRCCSHASPKRKIEFFDNNLSVPITPCHKQPRGDGNYEINKPTTGMHDGGNCVTKEVDGSGSPINNKNIPDTNTCRNESNSQNLQQIIRDLFTLLTDKDVGDKIQNSDNSVKQQEQLLRFVSSSKSGTNES